MGVGWGWGGGGIKERVVWVNEGRGMDGESTVCVALWGGRGGGCRGGIKERMV